MANSFNEAEASLPRNTMRTTGLALSPTAGFNEAEASLPRNTLNSTKTTLPPFKLQ